MKNAKNSHVKFFTVDADDNSDASQKSNIEQIPAVSLYKDGKLVRTVSDVQVTRVDQMINGMILVASS